MAERKVKCYHKDCLDNNLKYNKSEMTEIKGKRYCSVHAPEVAQEAEYQQLFYRALRSEFNERILPGMIYAQIKNLMKDGATYVGLYQTFMFMKRTKNISFELKYGIGLMKNYYNEGRGYDPEKPSQKITNNIDGTRVVIKKPEYHRHVMNEIKGDGLFDDE